MLTHGFVIYGHEDKCIYNQLNNNEGVIIYLYVGPVAQVENKDPPEDEMSSSEEIALMNKMWGLVLRAPESVSRVKTSSAELGRGLGKWINRKDDNL